MSDKRRHLKRALPVLAISATLVLIFIEPTLRKQNTVQMAMASALMLFGALGVSFWKVVWPMVRAEAFAPNPEHYNYATLPAHVPREVPPLPEAQFASPDAGQVTVATWQPEYRVLKVQANRAQVVLAEAEVPKAIAEAFRGLRQI